MVVDKMQNLRQNTKSTRERERERERELAMATRSEQSTPADNTRKRVWQYIEKERKTDGKTDRL